MVWLAIHMVQLQSLECKLRLVRVGGLIKANLSRSLGLGLTELGNIEKRCFQITPFTASLHGKLLALTIALFVFISIISYHLLSSHQIIHQILIGLGSKLRSLREVAFF